VKLQLVHYTGTGVTKNRDHTKSNVIIVTVIMLLP